MQSGYWGLGPKAENGTVNNLLYNSKRGNKMERESLTSPGQTVSRELVNMFAMSMRDNGLTPLTCVIKRVIIQYDDVSQWKGIRYSNVINGNRTCNWSY